MSPGSEPDPAVLEAPAHLNVCHLGFELVSVSKEKSPCGWLVWGTYPCCGAVLFDCLRVEPMRIVVAGREFDVTSRG